MLVETTHKKGANSVEMCHPQNITHLSTRHLQLQVLHANELIQNHLPVHVYWKCLRWIQYFCSVTETSLSFSLSSSVHSFFTQENKKEKKTTAAIATESKGRPGPGLSPLRHPDWSRPAVCALLPCGRQSRQFFERCCGRRAISAVLSGWICAAGSRLILFFPPLWHILWPDKRKAGAFYNFSNRDRKSAVLLIVYWYIKPFSDSQGDFSFFLCLQL